MAGPWEQYAVQTPAAAPWEAYAPGAPPVERRAQPRIATGVWEAMQAGWQSSIPGLVDRGRMPDIVLDAHHSRWYEHLAGGASQLFNEVPEMLVGGIAGGAVGSLVGPVGTIIGSGAGAFAVPTAIRQTLMESYSKGAITSVGDFLSRTGIVIKESAKSAAVGALTSGAGMVAARTAGTALAPMVGNQISVRTATNLIGAAETTAMVGAMTVAPAALEGRLPEPWEIMNAALLVGGLKGATVVSGKMANIYAKTGVRPEQVVVDARTDPRLAAELMGEPPIQMGTTRYYHGGSPESVTGSLWFTSDLRDAQGWAARDKDMKIWYVDIPTDHPVRGGDSQFGVLPPTRIELPSAFSSQRRLLDDPRLAAELRGEPVPGARAPLSEVEIPSRYRALAEEQMLRDALPEPIKVQEIMANPRGIIPPEGKEPNHINYRFTESPEDVQALRARISETMREEIEAARGTESWNRTQEKAMDVITERLAGMSDARKAELRSLEFTDLAAQSMAVEAMAQRAAHDARTAATEIALKGTAATAKDAARLAEAIETSAFLHSIDQANAAEIARTLNSRKAMRQRAELSEAMVDTLQTYGADPHALASIVLGLHTTAEMNAFARKVSKATKWEMVIEAYKAGLIGPISQVANILGNTTHMITRDVVDVLAAMRPGGQVRAVEPVARVMGQAQGFWEGLKIASEFLGENWKQPMQALRKLDEGPSVKMEAHRKAIPGDLGVLVRGLSFPWLSVMDGAFRLMSERGEANTWAARQAMKEGYNPMTREFRTRMAELAQNLPDDVAARVHAFGTRATFQDKLGPWGQNLQKLVSDSKVAPLFIPFMQTPANVFKEMARLTPLTAPFVAKWRADFKAGGAARDHAIAEIVIGGTLMTVAAALAEQGDMTGFGPVDPAKRRVWMDAGNQPYSIRIGDTWYDYSRIQPIGTLLGLASDMQEIREHMTPDEADRLPKMISIAFSQAVTNQVWLKGMVDIMRGVSEADRYGPRILQNLAGAMVPASGWLGQTASIIDPYIREVDSIMDAIRNRIPVAREGLQAKRETFGEKMPNPERFGVVSPIKTKTESDDPVRSEAARLGVGVSGAPKSVDLGGAYDRSLTSVKLTPEQKDIFSETSGKLAYQYLSPIVNADSWERRSDMEKKRIYEVVFEKTRNVARAKALPPDQLRSELTRIMEEVKNRMGETQ